MPDRYQKLPNKGPVDRSSSFLTGGGVKGLPWLVSLKPGGETPQGQIVYAPYFPAFSADDESEPTPITVTGIDGFDLPTTAGHYVWIEGTFAAGVVTGRSIETGAPARRAVWTGSLSAGDLQQTHFRFRLGYVDAVTAGAKLGFKFRTGPSSELFFYQLWTGALQDGQRNSNGRPFLFPELYHG